MTAIQLCEALLITSLSANAERSARWSNASHRVAGALRDHFILVVDVQQLGRLDCVIMELEGDLARLFTATQPHSPTLAPEFCLVLAKAWLSLTYEFMRTVKQRLLSKSELRRRWSAGLDHTFSILERVRVAELKREIANGGKLKNRIEMILPGDEGANTEEYFHGQTVLNSPLALRSTDGSIVWHAFNPELGRSEELFRRDMSEQILCELEKL